MSTNKRDIHSWEGFLSLSGNFTWRHMAWYYVFTVIHGKTSLLQLGWICTLSTSCVHMITPPPVSIIKEAGQQTRNWIIREMWEVLRKHLGVQVKLSHRVRPLSNPSGFWFHRHLKEKTGLSPRISFRHAVL